MKVQRFSAPLLAIAVLVGSLQADTSVQWGEEASGVAVNRGLPWKKPKTSSGVVTADRVANVGGAIQQVQYQGPVLPELNGANSPSAFGSTIPVPLLPAEPPVQPPKLQTPSSGESVPETGSTPAPGPLDSATSPTSRAREIECPGTAAFKSIREISYDIRPMPGELPKECPLITSVYTGRFYGRTCFFWTASGVCTKAAYFEDVQLERYGHSLCPALEPIFSGVRFFVTIPLLPYKMGLTPPNECVYTLGHYRVGNCAPYMLDPLPVSVRAVLFQTAAVGGAVAIFP